MLANVDIDLNVNLNSTLDLNIDGDLVPIGPADVDVPDEVVDSCGGVRACPGSELCRMPGESKTRSMVALKFMFTSMSRSRSTARGEIR